MASTSMPPDGSTWPTSSALSTCTPPGPAAMPPRSRSSTGRPPAWPRQARWRSPRLCTSSPTGLRAPPPAAATGWRFVPSWAARPGAGGSLPVTCPEDCDSPQDGRIIGIPRAGGTYRFTVRVLFRLHPPRDARPSHLHAHRRWTARPSAQATSPANTGSSPRRHKLIARELTSPTTRSGRTLPRLWRSCLQLLLADERSHAGRGADGRAS